MESNEIQTGFRCQGPELPFYSSDFLCGHFLILKYKYFCNILSSLLQGLGLVQILTERGTMEQLTMLDMNSSFLSLGCAVRSCKDHTSKGL